MRTAPEGTATMARDIASLHPADAPVPLHRLHAEKARAQRDRMLLLLGTCIVLALAIAFA